MNLSVKEIINKALDGGEINADELEKLFAVDYLSEESFLIQHAGRQMSVKASHGKAEIHGQVGINSGACPKDCEFCSFASVNKVFTKSAELPLDEVITRAVDMEQAGANAVYLLSTAMYKFDDFVRVGREVKKALKAQTPLIANVGDFDDAQAKTLKDVGFTGIYHAIRLGEGIQTKIDPQLRWKTVNAAMEAGLIIGTCLEPVGAEHSLKEMAEKTLFGRKMNPAFSGSARRVPIPNTSLAKHGSINYAKMALYIAAVRLAMGYSVVGNCTHEPNGIGAMAGANIMWAESGSNPRDTVENTVRTGSVDSIAEILTEAGWEILSGPSVMFAQR